MKSCENCTYLTARAAVDGKLEWGKFCTFPVYAFDGQPMVIDANSECPCHLKELRNEN